MGFYAYDTAAHPSATLRLAERCRAFEPKFVDALHEQRLGVGIAIHRQQHGTQILQGEMDELIGALIAEDEAERLATLDG